MEHEPIGYRSQRAKKADVVFDMLEDIETKEQIVMFMNVFRSPYSKFNPIGALDYPYCLRRRIVTYESCVLQRASDNLQHPTGSATDVHD